MVLEIQLGQSTGDGLTSSLIGSSSLGCLFSVLPSTPVSDFPPLHAPPCHAVP